MSVPEVMALLVLGASVLFFLASAYTIWKDRQTDDQA